MISMRDVALASRSEGPKKLKSRYQTRGRNPNEHGNRLPKIEGARRMQIHYTYGTFYSDSSRRKKLYRLLAQVKHHLHLKTISC